MGCSLGIPLIFLLEIWNTFAIYIYRKIWMGNKEQGRARTGGGVEEE